MSLIERFSEYVRACFTGLWIESHEHQDALTAIALLCRQEQWRLATWDIDQGLQVEDHPSNQRKRSVGSNQVHQLSGHIGRHGDSGAAELSQVSAVGGDRAGSVAAGDRRQTEPHDCGGSVSRGAAACGTRKAVCGPGA
jgi:hypothetical protein